MRRRTLISIPIEAVIVTGDTGLSMFTNRGSLGDIGLMGSRSPALPQTVSTLPYTGNLDRNKFWTTIFEFYIFWSAIEILTVKLSHLQTRHRPNSSHTFTICILKLYSIILSEQLSYVDWIAGYGLLFVQENFIFQNLTKVFSFANRPKL